jgi:hypothetical protein
LAVVVALLALVAYDLLQRRQAILRTFPVVGHLRFLLESFGPELRQYIVTSNDEERPFTRDQRNWVYACAQGRDTHIGFGTDNDIEREPGYLVIKHAAFPLPRPTPGEDALPAAKVLGAARGRPRAFRPASVVNVSAMSFGALSGNAIAALNRGARLAAALHNTGEGGLSDYHRQGGDLVFQIGTGYFGCRDSRGRFDLHRLVDTVSGAPVRAIEIKLSQGAKPGLGGMLPAAKITPAIAAARGVPLGQDCNSPAQHSAFRDVDGLLDFVEAIAAATGLPVGIKSAVGQESFWRDLTAAMAGSGRGVDFVTIDGGEGGTGAAPLVFADHVALPFLPAMARVYPLFVEAGLSDDVVFIGSGKLGFPESALLAFSLGCDLVNVGREAMLALGCIQAQRCQSGHCPTGVATQNAWLARGIDPEVKAIRVARYLTALRAELLSLSRACGREHPALLSPDLLEVTAGPFATTSVQALVDYQDGWGLPGDRDRQSVVELMRAHRIAEPAA